MLKIPTDKHGNNGWAVKARLQHRCEANWTYRNCLKLITPGTHYYRAIAWPGDDANGGTTPWVMRICRNCLNDEQRAVFDEVIEAAGRVLAGKEKGDE